MNLSKPLLAFAHKAEGQFFFEREKLTRPHPNNPYIFSNSEMMVLICGQGVSVARNRLADLLINYSDHISAIYNLGVAGSLHEKFHIHDIYQIKSVLYQDESKSIAEEGVTCISVDSPVKKDKLELSTRGHLVDMELWGLCEQPMIPVKSYKLVSDYCDDFSIDDIKNNSKFYAKKLYDFYKKNLA